MKTKKKLTITTKRKIKFSNYKKSCKIRRCNNNKALGVCQLDVCGKCVSLGAQARMPVIILLINKLHIKKQHEKKK